MAHVANFNVNVDKIDMSKAFQGEKGKYVNIEVWVNEEFDKFGNNATIAQISGSSDDKVKTYLGNGKGKFIKPKATEQEQTSGY